MARRENVHGQLDLLLLALIRDQPAHGYAVIERLRERSNGEFDLAEGTIYPALHQLHDDGLLLASWSVIDGRSRRTYRLSARGKRALESRTASWQRFTAAVSSIVEAAR
jgi:DNA-binding PadR family transcriptional regulator